MRKLVRLTLILVVIGANAITAAWLIGHLQPGLGRPTSSSDEAFVDGMALCARLPCFYGLIPGQSPWTDAQNRFAAWPNSWVSRNRIVVSDPRGGLVIDRAADGISVGTLALVLPVGSQFVVGDVLQLYGNPDAVRLNVSSHRVDVSLLYPTVAFDVQIAGDHLGAYEPIAQITFHDLTRHSSSLSAPCEENLVSGQPVNHAWKGFASLKHYSDTPGDDQKHGDT